MRGPTPETATHDLVTVGIHHATALALFDAAELSSTFREVNRRLLAAFEARLEAERHAAAPAASLAVVDVDLDALVMAFAQVVKAGQAEGRLADTLFATLFPRDVEDVVSPVGSAQAVAVQRIVHLVAERDDAAPLRDPWQKLLTDALARYQDSIQEHADAQARISATRSAEAQARAAWFDAVATNIAALEDDFPDSAVTERLFFPSAQA